MSGKPTYSRKVIEIADFMYKHPDKKIADVIAVFCGKLRKSKRTIEGYIAQAREYNKTRIQKQEKARDEVLSNEAREAIKKAILSRDESLEILSNIAQKSKRDNDRTRAIIVLADMQGWNAPIKNEIKGSISIDEWIKDRIK